MPRPFSPIKKVSVIRRCSLHVLLSYFACSLVFTYPLVFRLTTHVPGGKGDVPIYIWNLWWMKKALSEGISPLFCDYIFVPYGASLVFHTFVFSKAVLAVPLQWLCSVWATYNILILATSPTAARRPAIRKQLRELLSHLPNFLRERLLRNNSVRRFLADAPLKQIPRSGSLRDLVQTVNLGYVFVHPPYSDYAPIRHYLEAGLPLEQFYEHGGVIGYRVVAPMGREVE